MGAHQVLWAAGRSLSQALSKDKCVGEQESWVWVCFSAPLGGAVY